MQHTCRDELPGIDQTNLYNARRRLINTRKCIFVNQNQEAAIQITTIDLERKVRDLLRVNLSDPNTSRTSAVSAGSITNVQDNGGAFQITVSGHEIPDEEIVQVVAGGDLPAAAVGKWVAVASGGDITLRDSTYEAGWSTGGSINKFPGQNWIYEDLPKFTTKSWPRIGITSDVQEPRQIGVTANKHYDIHHLVSINILNKYKTDGSTGQSLTTIDELENAIIPLMKNNQLYFATHGYCQPAPGTGWAKLYVPNRTDAKHILRVMNFIIRERNTS